MSGAAATGGPVAAPSFFNGLPPEELERALGELERRRYAAGAVLIAEGDKPREMVIVRKGRAEVFVTDRQGIEHRVGRVGPGATLGEMSLFTGQPAAGTVRAAGDMEVLVMGEHEFERLAAQHPIVYRNLGAILSDRLARTNRLAARDATGNLGVLRDLGAPPELAWAIACSVAWHTRTATLLLVLGDAPGEELGRIASNAGAPGEPRAHLAELKSLAALRERSLVGQVEHLFTRYSQILVLARDDSAAELETARVVELTGPEGSGGDGPVVRAWVSGPEKIGPGRDGSLTTPPLDSGDVDAMRRGLLSTATPAGRATGWIARDLTGLKVGVALGAGSIRGYAHFGALHALLRRGVPIDYLVGTSVGALVAATHASGFTPAEGIEIFERGNSFVFRPTVPTRGLLSSRRLGKYFQDQLGDRRIEDLDVPLAIVAADLETQREVVFRRGYTWLALLASMAIPGIYPAVRLGPHTLVDGGVLNPVPSTVASAMGADVVIAVKLSGGTPPPDVEAEAVATFGPRPTTLAVLLRSVELMYTRLATDLTGSTVISITPDIREIPGAKLRNFSQGHRYVESGAEAVEAAMPRLAGALPWLRAR